MFVSYFIGIASMENYFHALLRPLVSETFLIRTPVQQSHCVHINLFTKNIHYKTID